MRPPLPFCSTLSSSGGKATWFRARSKNRGLQGIGWKSGGNWTRLGCFPTRLGSRRKVSKRLQRGYVKTLKSRNHEITERVSSVMNWNQHLVLSSYRVVFHLLLRGNFSSLISVWKTKQCFKSEHKEAPADCEATESFSERCSHLKWQQPAGSISQHWPQQWALERQEDPTETRKHQESLSVQTCKINQIIILIDQRGLIVSIYMNIFLPVMFC